MLEETKSSTRVLRSSTRSRSEHKATPRKRKRDHKVTIKGSSSKDKVAKKKQKKEKRIRGIGNGGDNGDADLVKSFQSLKIKSNVFGYAKTQGLREHMEDHYAIVSNKGRHLYAVFDGHSGDDVGSWLEKHFASMLFKRMDENKISMSQSKKTTRFLERFLLDVDHEIFIQLKDTDAGSTVLFCLSDNVNIYMCTCGDSRGIIFNMQSQNHSFATVDHKPNDIDEKERINKLGFKVINDHGTWRTDGNLAMSRAVGDFMLKPGMASDTSHEEAISKFPVIALPTVSYFSIDELTTDGQERKESKENKQQTSSLSASSVYVLLASDGLWDVMSNEYAYKTAKTFLEKSNGNVQQLCDFMVQESLKRKTQDNVCVVCAELTL